VETMMAYCGLVCDTCPIHLASLEPDEAIRARMKISIAEQCLQVYGIKLRPEDIDACDGCKSTSGRLFSGCLACKIRKCASMKQLENCAWCEEYPCDDLKAHFSLDPQSEIRLEKIRHGR